MDGMIVYNYTQKTICMWGFVMSDQSTFQNRPVTMNDKNNLLKIEEHMYILDDVV